MNNDLATIAFFDVLGRAATQKDLLRFGGSGKINHPRIQQQGKYIFLAGRQEVIAERERREVISWQYWKRVRRLVRFFGLVPFVEAVAVCNNLAFDHCSEESDIDLFIITKAGRIFTARTVATLLFHVLGVRRHGRKIAGRLCLSFYVSEDGMGLEKMQLSGGDPYLQFWMKSLRFVYSKNPEVVSRFVECNSWVQPLSKESGVRPGVMGLFGRVGEWLLDGRLGEWLEGWFARIHKRRFERRKDEFGNEASIVIGPSTLKFHNIDRRGELNRRFFEVFDEISK